MHRPDRSFWPIALTLLVVILAIYHPVRHHAFVDLDDFAGIVWNPDLETTSAWQAVYRSFARPLLSIWAPLTLLSIHFDRWLYGIEPAGYLLTNVGLHAATTLLIFYALWRSTGARWASAFVAAVFAVHPLHVESVAWASERKDTLSALFFALCWIAYLRYVDRPDSRGRYALLLALFVLGLMAKPMLVTLPGVLLLLDVWPLRRFGLPALREKLPLLAIAVADAYVTWVVQALFGAMSFAENLPMELRIANAIDAAVIYLAQTFWPSGLAVFYPHPGASLGWTRVALEAALLAALTGAAFAVRRSQPWWWVGWLWYGMMLVPVIGVVQVGMQGRADRYTYLPMIGLAIAVAFGVRHLARTRALRAVAAAAGVAALAALSIAAARQVHTWRDSGALYARAIEVSPGASYPHLRLGMVHAMTGDFGRAQLSFRTSVALASSEAPEIVRQLDNMAQAHARSGRAEQAVATAAYAIQFAEETGQDEAAGRIRDRLPELRQGSRALRPPW